MKVGDIRNSGVYEQPAAAVVLMRSVTRRVLGASLRLANWVNLHTAKHDLRIGVGITGFRQRGLFASSASSSSRRTLSTLSPKVNSRRCQLILLRKVQPPNLIFLRAVRNQIASLLN
jgi:hypothetical protein